MKLTSVELHDERPFFDNFIVMSFRDPGRANPYNVKTIIGLDADEIASQYYGVYGDNNTKLYNLALQKRDIIMRVALNPNFSTGESFSDLRDYVYKLISASRTGRVEIKFKNEDDVVALVTGYISKIEAPHFNKEPEIQITVKCDETLLKGPDRVYISAEDLALNNVGLYTEDLLSTAPHGLKFKITFTANEPSLKMTDHATTPTYEFELVPPGGFLDDDVLHISSEINNKYVHVVRAGVTIPLANAISPGSIWPLMFPDFNVYLLYASAHTVWTEVSYYPTYWGV